MRAMVTGAAGFIGSTLVDRLLADGHQVVGIDNFRTGIAANLEHAFSCSGPNQRRFTLIKVDIQAPELIDIVAGANPHVIFHLAAQVDLCAAVSDPQLDARSNVLGTINLCEASRRAGVRRIVYAASGASRYGAQTGLPVDETNHVDPLSPHAVGKLAGEMYLRAYAEMYGLAPICLALANVYGPRQNPHGAAGVIAVLGTAMITGRPLWVYRDGAAAHDYVYVDDVVDAFVRAGCAPLDTTGTYNVGTGQHTTLTEVHGLMSAVLDGSTPPSLSDDPSDELNAIALNATKAAKDLDWKPTVDLAEGIRRTMRWLCDTLEPEAPALVGA
jgi:UDP-glucose 4-epimerase